jgi:transcriptional regulator with XRE-family HTH domain
VGFGGNVERTPIGQVLYETRMKKGMSTLEVGRLIECSGTTIIRWESGVSAPADRFYYKLSRFLGLTFAEVEKLCEQPTTKEA